MYLIVFDGQAHIYIKINILWEAVFICDVGSIILQCSHDHSVCVSKAST